MSTNPEERYAQLFPSMRPPKPTRVIDEAGWVQLPSGAWFRPGPRSPIQFTEERHQPAPMWAGWK